MYSRETFAASLARCRESADFSAAFYERLLASDDDIRAKFRFTNMKAQRSMLEQALVVCGDVVAGKPEALARLGELGRSHDAMHLDIRPEWYPLWLEAIVKTASEFDPQWTPEVRQAWQSVLGPVTKRIASFYDG